MHTFQVFRLLLYLLTEKKQYAIYIKKVFCYLQQQEEEEGLQGGQT